MCLFLAFSNAEVIDRIAISVTGQVITETQILEEIRITAFENQQKPDYSPEQKKAAGDRLIEQTLVKREMELSHYPQPEPQEAAALEDNLLERYGGREKLLPLLAKAGLTEDEVTAHLAWQLTLLRFIDYRFRPSVQITDAAVRAYYEKQRAEWTAEGIQSIPTLEQSRARIETILTEQSADAALDRWLVETRKQLRIVYHPEAFQ